MKEIAVEKAFINISKNKNNEKYRPRFKGNSKIKIP